MNTYVIDLYAGPGAGKSTLAAETFAVLNKQGARVELVREYVKWWAWRQHKIERWDGPYFAAKQLRMESSLYGKVDVIITDSPILMTAIYEELYQPDSTLLLNFCTEIYRQQKKENVFHIPCLVTREKPYVAQGRYETAEQAKGIDVLCHQFLSSQGTYYIVSTPRDILEVLSLRAGLVYEHRS